MTCLSFLCCPSATCQGSRFLRRTCDLSSAISSSLPSRRVPGALMSCLAANQGRAWSGDDLKKRTVYYRGRRGLGIRKTQNVSLTRSNLTVRLLLLSTVLVAGYLKTVVEFSRPSSHGAARAVLAPRRLPAGVMRCEPAEQVHT